MLRSSSKRSSWRRLESFECADVSALCTDFLLEISDHALQVFSAEAGAEELIPEPFAIEAQAES